MKRFHIIILIFSVFVLSCYQSPDTSSTGSVSLNLSAVTKSVPSGYDGELRLAVYLDGELDSYISKQSVTGAPEISYLAELPSPLLENNSIPYTGTSGNVSLLNVPAGVKLNLLVEHYGTENVNGSDQYFLNYSGVSDSFEVEAGENTNVSVSLLETALGTLNLDFSEKFSTLFCLLLDESVCNSYISISGSEIRFDRDAAIDSLDLATDYSSPVDPITFNDMLPGKKMKILVRNQQYNDNKSDVGVSEAFEMLPGQTLNSLKITYYTFIS